MLDISEIENILYDGTKEEIEKVLKEYEISFSYSSNNFDFKSNKLLLLCRGYKSSKKPNCVIYFGDKY